MKITRLGALVLLVVGWGCTQHPQPEEGPKQTPARVITTAGQAREAALAELRLHPTDTAHLQLETLTVYEEPTLWNVYILSNKPAKPSGARISVDKTTGRATYEWLK